MLSNKDYTQMTQEELLSEAQKLKSQNIGVAVLIGLFIGIAVYAATHRAGFFVTVLILGIAWFIARGHTSKLKRVQEEISRRG